MKRPKLRLLAVLAVAMLVTAGAAIAQDGEIRLIIRGDDLGMSHGTNMAFLKAFTEGVLTCGAVQVPAPWFEEAADMCIKNPGWCVGVHLCLIGEWIGYRWRPVLPWSQVSSLVDEDGYLFPYPEALFANNPKLTEIEAEFRAQIELAKKRGINIQYLDTHYMSYTGIPGLEDIYKKLGREYDLPISGMMGESRFPGVYNVQEDLKIVTATKQLEELTPGLWLWVNHIGIDSPEQNAMIHTKHDHIFRGGGVGKHRAAELETLTSIQVKSMILMKQIKTVSYHDLWMEQKKQGR